MEATSDQMALNSGEKCPTKLGTLTKSDVEGTVTNNSN